MVLMWLYLSNDLVRCVAGRCYVSGCQRRQRRLHWLPKGQLSAQKQKKKSASRESCLARDSGSYCARVAYMNEVALVAGSLHGMMTQSIAPIDRVDAEGYSIHRRPQVISECAKPNDGSEPCLPGVKVPAAPHLAGTCMSLSSTSSGLPTEPATELHTSVSAIMTYDECYNVCNEYATIYSALQGDTLRWLARTPEPEVSNMSRSTTICFDYQNRLKPCKSSCPHGMHLARHDPVCDPILRKWVVRQRCYTVECLNAPHIRHAEVQSLCNEDQEHDGCDIHCSEGYEVATHTLKCQAVDSMTPLGARVGTASCTSVS